MVLWNFFNLADSHSAESEYSDVSGGKDVIRIFGELVDSFLCFSPKKVGGGFVRELC